MNELCCSPRYVYATSQDNTIIAWDVKVAHPILPLFVVAQLNSLYTPCKSSYTNIEKKILGHRCAWHMPYLAQMCVPVGSHIDFLSFHHRPLQDQKIVSTLTGHSQTIKALDMLRPVSGTEAVLVSCSFDKTVRVWTSSGE